MSKEAMRLALEAAYLAGFNASGEGYNGEYGIDCPEENAIWKKDRDKALKEALAEQEPVQPKRWTPEDMAHRPGGLAQPDHPEQMARLGWQYVECFACGSEGARGFPRPEQEPVAWMSEQDVGFKKSEFGATPTVPLYTFPPAHPVRTPLTVQEIAEFVGTHEYGPEQLKWFRFGEAAHNIKENT